MTITFNDNYPIIDIDHDLPLIIKQISQIKNLNSLGLNIDGIASDTFLPILNKPSTSHHQIKRFNVNLSNQINPKMCYQKFRLLRNLLKSISHSSYN